MTPAPSDHFNGKTFFNPGGDSERGIRDLLKWKLTSRAARWPGSVPVEQRQPPPPPAAGISATWIGHSTFLIRAGGLCILTDPVFSDIAGPFGMFGPRRTTAPGIAFGSLPRIDLVLLSHDHYDHCDLPTLRRLASRDNPVVVAPLGHAGLLGHAGVRKVVELDWWQSAAPVPGAEVTLVPARHWSRRRPFATNVRLWGGFMFRAAGRRLYFAGDSGYQEGLFRGIGSRCGAPDLAMLPIGAYEPRWFMKEAHMNPAEAVMAHREVGSRKSVAMHWGTFQLTDEAREEPVRALEAARGSDDFSALQPGETIPD